jgi:hypothetical protein
VYKGNTTYQLTHTRYLSEKDAKTVAAPADQEDPVEETQGKTVDVVGLSRDQTIGHQVTTAVGKGPWEKRVFSALLQIVDVDALQQVGRTVLSRSNREFPGTRKSE